MASSWRSGADQDSVNLYGAAALAKDNTLVFFSSHSVQNNTMQASISIKLQRWNWAMALFHALFMTATLILGNVDLRVTVYEARLTARAETDEPFGLAPVYDAVGTLPLTILCALFFLLSSVFHLGNALLWRAEYERRLDLKQTPFRWLEYFFSAPVMMLTIAYATGIQDAVALFMMSMLVATTMLFGWLHELLNRPDPCKDEWQLPLSQRFAAHILGYIPQLSAWGAVIYTFVRAVTGGEGPPTFVYYIVAIEAVLFFSFGIAQVVVTLLPPSQFINGEILYQILSLVSKGLLGLLLLVNVLALSLFE